MYCDTGTVAELKQFLLNRDIWNFSIEMYIANWELKLLIKSEAKRLTVELQLQNELDMKTLSFYACKLPSGCFLPSALV